MRRAELHVMGCSALLAIDAESEGADRALRDAASRLVATARVLSRFDPASALAQLNTRGGADAVDPILWDAIDIALRVAEATEGRVTPTILPALERAGYDRTFTQLPRASPVVEAEVRAVPSHRLVERDPAARAVRLPPGVTLDLAGTAKAAAADAALEVLARWGPALVDLGGDIATSPGRGWPIAVDDPFGGADVDLVVLDDGGIATSGVDHRRWRRGGEAFHHIVDPRTGGSARTDVWTATVVARTALEADVAAKRILIDGSTHGMRWSEDVDLAALVTLRDGRVLRSSRFEDVRWRSS